MKKIFYTILAIISVSLLSSCSSLSDVEKQEIKQYAQYTNKLVETTLQKQEGSQRKKLEPYRTRYRLFKSILQQKLQIQIAQ